MPHVIIKIATGYDEQQKQLLADEISQTLVRILSIEEQAISIDIEDIDVALWNASVYDKNIKPNIDHLYKKPGYQR